MEENRILENRIYKHFKGNLYYILNIAVHSETNEKYVVYRALYDNYEVYIRTLEMFNEKIDVNRPDNVDKQIFRFELYK